MVITFFIILLALVFSLLNCPMLSSAQRRIQLTFRIKPFLGHLGKFIYGVEVAIGSYLVNYFFDMGPTVVKQNEVMARLPRLF
ncbi:MAG: hypothetical protein CM15mP83_5150 [Flavobacteriaceae bacterium]|nr:MAG: hypothetical protein CM15mP83_5150 [Flavobacteriaceae bacterium]